jgi:hypothetical protein
LSQVSRGQAEFANHVADHALQFVELTT